MHLDPSIVAAAKAHALAEYPRESCGFVVGNDYWPCFNYAVDPTKFFHIAPQSYIVASKTEGGIRAVLHSHPGGPYYPSQSDMQGQIETNVPWGIIVTDGERASDPVMWGDQLPIPPLLGREFMHGVTDCYNAIRDAFRLGREALAEQGMPDWPHDSITLPEVPRDDAWWRDEGVDLYQAHFEKFGFARILHTEAKPGDVFLMKVKSDRLNHGGVLISPDLILHHLPKRLSRREPANQWMRHINMWIRRA